MLRKILKMWLFLSTKILIKCNWHVSALSKRGDTWAMFIQGLTVNLSFFFQMYVYQTSKQDFFEFTLKLYVSNLFTSSFHFNEWFLFSVSPVHQKILFYSVFGYSVLCLLYLPVRYPKTIAGACNLCLSIWILNRVKWNLFHLRLSLDFHLSFRGQALNHQSTVVFANHSVIRLLRELSRLRQDFSWRMTFS